MKFAKKKREYLLEWLQRRLTHHYGSRENHPDFWDFTETIIEKVKKDLELAQFTSGELTFIFNSRVGSGILFTPWTGKKGILTIVAEELERRGISRGLWYQFPVAWGPDLERIREERRVSDSPTQGETNED